MPINPFHRQEFVLVNSLTNPSYQWRFKYNALSSSSYKWEFIGGPEYYIKVESVGSQNSSTYSDASDAGPTFTTPYAGDWQADHGYEGSVSANEADIYWNTAPAGSRVLNNDGTARSNSGFSIGLSIASGATVKQQYRSPIGSANYSDRWIAILPIRIG